TETREHFSRLLAEPRPHLRIRIARFVQCLSGLAIKRKLVHERIQAVRRSGMHLPLPIEITDQKLVFRQALLNIAKKLRRLRSEFAVWILDQQSTAFLLGPQRLRPVTIALLYLVVMNLANAVLRLGR